KIVDIDAVRDIPSATRDAYRTALAGEPGPVLLHVNEACIMEPASGSALTADAPRVPHPEEDTLQEAVRMGAASQRPVLFVGQGSQNAAGLLKELAEWLHAPVITTRSGRGVIPEDHPLSLQFDFREPGVQSLNAVLDRSDLILAIGCKFTHNG